MPAKIKVYAGLVYKTGRRRQTRVLVATTSQKRVAEIVGVSLAHVRNFWSVTGNSDEIEAAMAAPETIVDRGEI